MVHIIGYLQISLGVFLLHIGELNLKRPQDDNTLEVPSQMSFFSAASQLGFTGEVKLNMTQSYLRV